MFPSVCFVDDNLMIIRRSDGKDFSRSDLSQLVKEGICRHLFSAHVLLGVYK